MAASDTFLLLIFAFLIGWLLWIWTQTYAKGDELLFESLERRKLDSKEEVAAGALVMGAAISMFLIQGAMYDSWTFAWAVNNQELQFAMKYLIMRSGSPVNYVIIPFLFLLPSALYTMGKAASWGVIHTTAPKQRHMADGVKVVALIMTLSIVFVKMIPMQNAVTAIDINLVHDGSHEALLVADTLTHLSVVQALVVCGNMLIFASDVFAFRAKPANELFVLPSSSASATNSLLQKVNRLKTHLDKSTTSHGPRKSQNLIDKGQYSDARESFA